MRWFLAALYDVIAFGSAYGRRMERAEQLPPFDIGKLLEGVPGLRRQRK
jgi:hypothetical protein